MLKTSAREEAVKLLEAETTITEVAKQLNLPISTVGYWKRQAGMGATGPLAGRKLAKTEKKKAKALKLLQQGKNISYLRQHLNLSYSKIMEWKREAGLLPPAKKQNPGPRPETEAKRDEAVALMRAGVPHGQIRKKLYVGDKVLHKWRKAAKLPPPATGRRSLADQEKAVKALSLMSSTAVEKKQKPSRMPATAVEALARIPKPSASNELRRLVVKYGVIEIRRLLDEIEAGLLHEV